MARHQKKIGVTHWTVGSAARAALSAGTGANTVLAAQHLPETLLRTRGEILVFADATQAPGGGVGITCGLILVPEGTGSTVLWSPSTDGDAPWIWWDTFAIAYEEMVTDVIALEGCAYARRVIDSKAMRHNRNQELQFVIENSTITSAMSVNAFMEVRVLAGS